VKPAAARPLLYGHRGASALSLENTLGAFARARTDGADGIELDVRLTADGELAVFHDEDLVRIAGRPGRVAQMSWRELAAVSPPWPPPSSGPARATA
jgi:glycerophosphoryl diester phosphodiesterase